MRKFENIVQSDIEPMTTSLWIKDNILYYYSNGTWKPLGSDTTEIEKIVKDILYNDSEAIDSLKEIEEFLKGVDNGETLIALLNDFPIRKGTGENSAIVNDLNSNTASGVASYAEGRSNVASGNTSHAEGFGNKANGKYSHAEGYHTQTTQDAEHAEGQYNVSNSNTLSSVGNGIDGHRHNAYEVKKDGNILISDIYGSGEYYEKPMLSIQEEFSKRYTKEEVDNELYELDTNGYEFVDLGLPSGKLWATCNIGADNPEDAGLYFAWGETVGYTDTSFKEGGFSWDTYKFSIGKKSATIPNLTKYCNNAEHGYEGFTDNLIKLEIEDDAAHVNMGGGWRIPTVTEFTEMLNNTTMKKETNYKGKDINGFLFTSKINGNSIFIPYCGYAQYSNVANFNASVIYQTCEMNSSPQYANSYNGNFINSNLIKATVWKFAGCPVRAILDPIPSKKYLTKKEAQELYQPKGEYTTKEEIDKNVFFKSATSSQTPENVSVTGNKSTATGANASYGELFNIPKANQNLAGVMSATDKQKLDSLNTIAEDIEEDYTLDDQTKAVKLLESEGRKVMFPITTEECVYDEDGNKLSDKLSQIEETHATKDEAKSIAKIEAAAIVDTSPEKVEVLNILEEKLNDDENIANQVVSTIADAKEALFIDLWDRACIQENTVHGKYDYENAPNKSKPYLLNKLYLSYEEAVITYIAGKLNTAAPGSHFMRKQIRTNLPNNSTPGIFNCEYTFEGCKNLEIVFPANYVPRRACFKDCVKLKEVRIYYIDQEYTDNNHPFTRCTSLETITFVVAQTKSFYVGDSPNLTLETMQHFNVRCSSGITITVHPDVYAKLTDTENTEWYQVLQDAQAKNITFATTA